MRKGGLYLAIGDSTVWTKADELYSSKIAKHMRENKFPIQLSNKGMGASTASRWVQSFKFLVSQIPYDVITIGLGMNDCTRGTSALQTFNNDLTQLIKWSKEIRPTADIILCAPNHTNSSTRTPYIQSYRDEMETIANDNNVLFCDFSKAFSETQVSSRTVDGTHPNNTGHNDIFNTLLPIFKQTNFYND